MTHPNPHTHTQATSPMSDNVLDEPSHIYRVSPQTLTKYGRDIIQANLEGNSPDGEDLRRVYDAYIEHNKVLKISSASVGLDEDRFLADEEYKRCSVYGLAMSDKLENLLIAVVLSKLEGWDVWEIFAANIEYLFTEAAVYVGGDVMRVVGGLGVMGELKLHADDFIGRLKNNVYPLLDGKESEKIIDYFMLLGKCGVRGQKNQVVVDGLNVDVVVELFKNIQHSTTNVDFKKLIESKQHVDSLCGLLVGVVNEGNVTNVARLLPQVNTNITRSNVMVWWATRYFWEDTLDWSLAKCRKRLKRCQEWIVELEAGDLGKFVEEVLFSEAAVDLMSFVEREKLSVQLHKFVGGRIEKSKNKDQQKQLEDVCVRIQRMNEHLCLLSSQSFEDFLSKFNFNEKKKFLRLFDTSMLEGRGMLHVYEQLIQQSLPRVKRLLAIVPGEKLTIQDVIAHVVYRNIKHREGNLSTIIQSIENIDDDSERSKHLEQIHAQVEDGLGKVGVRDKVRVLKVLDEHQQLTEDEKKKFVLFQILEKIREKWGDDVIGAGDDVIGAGDDVIGALGNQSFVDLLQRLLKLSSTLSEYETLLGVVGASGRGKRLFNDSSGIMDKLLDSIVKQGGGGLVVRFVLEQDPTQDMLEAVVEIFERNQHKIFALKLILSSKRRDSSKLREIMKGVTKINETNFDDEVASLLLETFMTSSTIETLYFREILKFATTRGGEVSREAMQRFISETQRSGFVVEASVAMHRYLGGHPTFMVFGSAIQLISSFNCDE
ncbi:NBAS subunit of NRZ tethering complex-like [Ciona intestinalis]